MTVTHHLDDATVLSFAAGTLPTPIALVVSAHLSLCPSCAARVRAAEAIGSAFLEDEAPVRLSAGSVNNLFERLNAETTKDHTHEERIVNNDESDSILPPQVRKALGVPFSEIHWKRISRGVGLHTLDLGEEDEGKLYLMKIEAGRVMPSHGHGGSEVTLVLSGSYTDHMGQFKRGDIADLDDHVEHQPVVDPGAECICLVASEQPARFTGIIPRLFQPLIGI